MGENGTYSWATASLPKPTGTHVAGGFLLSESGTPETGWSRNNSLKMRNRKWDMSPFRDLGLERTPALRHQEDLAGIRILDLAAGSITTDIDVLGRIKRAVDITRLAFHRFCSWEIQLRRSR